MNKPKLSIIIPCYNCSETLEEAFDSAYHQDLDIPFEIVMVDDGSSDRTPDLMRRLAKGRSNVVTVFHAHNRGGGATRNTAVRHSSADIIFCLDSDDILPANTLKQMYRLMTDKGCDGVGIGQSIKFSGTDRSSVEATHLFGTHHSKIVFEDLLQKQGLCALYSTFMHTKRAFEITGGYAEDHGFDTQSFAWRFLANGLTAHVCPEAQYLHRINFHRSYYIREYEDGRVNHNWFKIFDEFFHLFSPAAQTLTLSTNLNNPRCDLFSLLQSVPETFCRNYRDYLCPDGRTRYLNELGKLEPAQWSTHQLYWLGSEYLRQHKPAQALEPLLKAKKLGLKSNALQDKIQISKLCLGGETLTVATAKVDKQKKYKKLGSQSAKWRKTLIWFKKHLRPIKRFYLELKDRRQAERFAIKAVALGGLYLKKMMKLDFNDYRPTPDAIDVVVPTIAKDLAVLETSLTSLRNLAQPINQVFIVSRPEEGILQFCQAHNYHFINEVTVLGYTKDEIKYTVGGQNRSGWIYQQLLKLGADAFVQKDNYLVLDSDTVLVAPHSFISDHRYVLQANTDWHQPYLETFKKLFGINPANHLSSVCHMMLFNTRRVREMRQQIERVSGKKWDRAIIDALDLNQASSFSEYETYANWLAIHYPQEIKRVPFYNQTLERRHLMSLAELEQKYGKKLKSVSFHSYAG